MSQFRNLVFEGGGVKGIAYAGAIEVLEAKEILPDIQRVAGTSAGAITAALLALGARSGKVAAIVGSTDFRRFMDDSWGVARDINRLLHEYGWYKGDEFSAWMKKHIGKLVDGDEELTFGQLTALAQNQGADGPTRCRELYTVASDLSTQLPQVFSAESTPDVPIWKAVRMSMSIPLFFACVRRDGHVVVDGGVTWNYPIDVFDDVRYLSNPDDETTSAEADYPTRKSDGHVYNKETLGLRVATSDEIKAQRQAQATQPREIEDLMDYAGALLGFMMDNANRAHLHKNDWHRTIFLEADGVKFTDFSLPDSKVAELMANGRKGAEAYFEWFENPPEGDEPLNKVG